MLTESSFIVKDGVVYMFSRSGGNLWVSFSSDWGRTWSLPYQTNFTDASSKFMCGQLPDGRYYFVSNPGPNTSEGNRLPLTIAISSDGINWSEQYILGDTPRVQRMEGMYKGGHYAYPNCFIGDDGYFYVIYSVHKEDIEVVRFKLQELGIASSEQN